SRLFLHVGASGNHLFGLCSAADGIAPDGGRRNVEIPSLGRTLLCPVGIVHRNERDVFAPALWARSVDRPDVASSKRLRRSAIARADSDGAEAMARRDQSSAAPAGQDPYGGGFADQHGVAPECPRVAPATVRRHRYAGRVVESVCVLCAVCRIDSLLLRGRGRTRLARTG